MPDGQELRHAGRRCLCHSGSVCNIACLKGAHHDGCENYYGITADTPPRIITDPTDDRLVPFEAKDSPLVTITEYLRAKRERGLSAPLNSVTPMVPEVVTDPAAPPDEIMFRRRDGQVVGRIVGLGTEIRATDPKSGGQKGRKPQRYDLIPWDVMDEFALVYGKGAEKYEDRNWEKGYPLSWSMAALGRHLSRFMQGEDRDPETGAHHLAQVMFHAAFGIRFGGTEFDDRPNRTRGKAPCPDRRDPQDGGSKEGDQPGADGRADGQREEDGASGAVPDHRLGRPLC